MCKKSFFLYTKNPKTESEENEHILTSQAKLKKLYINLEDIIHSKNDKNTSYKRFIKHTLKKPTDFAVIIKYCLAYFEDIQTSIENNAYINNSNGKSFDGYCINYQNYNIHKL